MNWRRPFGPGRLLLDQPRLRSAVVESLYAVGVVSAVSLIISIFNALSRVSNISNLYVIGVALLAARRGRYPAIMASVLAFLAYNWFFIHPVGTFGVDDPSEYVALLTLLVTSVLIGQLLALVRSRAEEARQQQIRTTVLYEVSQAALSNAMVKEVYELALRHLAEPLGLSWSRLFLRDGPGMSEVATYGTHHAHPDQPRILRCVLDEGRPLGAWRRLATSDLPVVDEIDIGTSQIFSLDGGTLEEIYIPMSLESRVEGVLIVGTKLHGEPLSTVDARFLLAFANQLASAVQRDRLEDQRARARALEESDRLKTALVSSVSHELKTPLTTIKASAAALLEIAASATAGMPSVDAGYRELAESIDRETDRLTRLVSNLLDISRLESGALAPRIELVSIGDVIADVLDRMDPVLGDHEVITQLAEPLADTPLDFVLICQVLTNLLDNAIRYSSPSARIVVSGEVARDQLRVSVFNEGNEIPPEELERIFDKFYRLSTASGGIGLGLAITRGIIEAHRGHIWAENVAGRGVAFTFSLPSPPPLSLAVPNQATENVYR